MFTRVFKSTVILSVVAFLAIRGAASSTNNSQCDTGTLQCCNKMVSSTVLQQAGLLGLLSTVPGDIGLTCTPITVLGTGNGADCQQQPVCCSNVTQNGIINFGCSPVNVNL